MVDDKSSCHPNLASGSRISMKLSEVASRQDSKGECTEVKFSPSNDLVCALVVFTILLSGSYS